MMTQVYDVQVGELENRPITTGFSGKMGTKACVAVCVCTGALETSASLSQLVNISCPVAMDDEIILPEKGQWGPMNKRN